MWQTRNWSLAALAALMTLLAQPHDASAGLFRGPYDFSIGPYRGGQGWSYNESYGYFGVPSNSTYPYYAYFPYAIYTPYGWGLRNTRSGLLGGRGYYGDGIYGINPAYLTAPGAPGYSKASARNVVLPPMKQMNGLAATIDIHMPCFGELWVDGVATEQLGTDRLFRSPPLEKSGEYIYVLRARWIDGNGRPVEQTRQVRVHCGERVRVVFPLASRSMKP